MAQPFQLCCNGGGLVIESEKIQTYTYIVQLDVASFLNIQINRLETVKKR